MTQCLLSFSGSYPVELFSIGFMDEKAQHVRALRLTFTQRYLLLFRPAGYLMHCLQRMKSALSSEISGLERIYNFNKTVIAFGNPGVISWRLLLAFFFVPSCYLFIKWYGLLIFKTKMYLVLPFTAGFLLNLFSRVIRWLTTQKSN